MMRWLMNFALFTTLFDTVVGSEVVETGWFSEEDSGRNCPTRQHLQSIVTGLFCSGKYCDNLKLQCTYKEGYTRGSEIWTPFFSEEQGRGFCPGRSVLSGMRCRGSYCDDISLRCSPVSLSLYPNKRYCDETDWVSEEHGGHKVIPSHSYPVGVRCGGSYCDNKKITYCYERGYGPNTGWFSEENNGSGVCPIKDGSLTMLWGLSCSGAYCDNLKINCASIGTLGTNLRSKWTEWFSEETPKQGFDGQQGEMSCISGEIITGIRCRGSYCDDLSLQCTQVHTLFGYCARTGWFSEEGAGYVEIPEGAYPVGITCRGAYCDDKQIKYCYINKNESKHPYGWD